MATLYLSLKLFLFMVSMLLAAHCLMDFMVNAETDKPKVVVCKFGVFLAVLLGTCFVLAMIIKGG